MRRYLPLLLIAFFILIVTIVTNLFLSGYADRQNSESLKSITLYTTLPIEQVIILAQEYEKTQKVRVQVVLLGEKELLSRLKIEQDKPSTDVILSNSSVLELLRKQSLLAPYASEQTDIIPGLFCDPDSYWVGVWYDPIVFAVNRDLLKLLPQVPQKWSDLPQNNKLRIGITDFLAADATANLFFSMVAVGGEEQVLNYFKKIHPQIVQYSKFLATPVRMVGMGEVDLAIAVQSETVRYINDSFPIKIIYPEEGTSYLLTAVGLVKDAPHAGEAKQFIDWLVQAEAQNALVSNKYFFVHTNPELRKNRYYSEKNIELFETDVIFPPEKKHELLDQWVQTVRLNVRK